MSVRKLRHGRGGVVPKRRHWLVKAVRFVLVRRWLLILVFKIIELLFKASGWKNN